MMPMTIDPLGAFRMDGDVVIITGAGNGLGRAFAQCFARIGAKVMLLDQNAAAAEECATGINQAGGIAEWHAVDVTQESAVDQAFAAIVARYGRVDVLINNAGIAIRRPTVDLSLADWNKVVDVNLTGVFLCCKAAGRYMLQQGGGRIVNIASIIRPPDSLSVQRETTSFTTSSLYSKGILYRASTRFLMRFNCSLTILPSISSLSG